MTYVIGAKYKIKSSFQPVLGWSHFTHYKQAIFTIVQADRDYVYKTCSICKGYSIIHTSQFNEIYTKLSNYIIIKKVDLCNI